MAILKEEGHSYFLAVTLLASRSKGDAENLDNAKNSS
jgi:hypothetical protein